MRYTVVVIATLLCDVGMQSSLFIAAALVVVGELADV